MPASHCTIPGTPVTEQLAEQTEQQYCQHADVLDAMGRYVVPDDGGQQHAECYDRQSVDVCCG